MSRPGVRRKTAAFSFAFLHLRGSPFSSRCRRHAAARRPIRRFPIASARSVATFPAQRAKPSRCRCSSPDAQEGRRASRRLRDLRVADGFSPARSQARRDRDAAFRLAQSAEGFCGHPASYAGPRRVSRQELASHISGRIGNSRDILIFHGFNTSLEEARFRLAQIVADGGFTGVPILFTWPSKGELFAYESDKESATASRDALQRLIFESSQVPGVGRVHVLAHSMGSWLTMEALRENAIAGRPDLDGRLGSVMLAAPTSISPSSAADRPPRSFARLGIRFARRSRLSLSSRIAGSRPRLGAMDPSNPKDAAGDRCHGRARLRPVDVQAGWIGHDTYANAPEAVRQIGATLTKSANPTPMCRR